MSMSYKGLTEQVVTWQQTMNLLKVKTWTWHSHVTELAYLDVSKLSSNVPCLSNGKEKEKGTFVALLAPIQPCCSGIEELIYKETGCKVIVK